MAAEPTTTTKRPTASEEPEQSTQVAPKGAPFWSRLSLGKWMAIVLGLSIALQGLGLLCYHLCAKSPASPLAAEIPLGTFQFNNDQAEAGSIANAEFAVYVTLLEQIDRQARPQVAARHFRIQQDIEQLLRQAHGGDFADPTLGEIKRQLQEQINGSLGMRAIGDVIIADLKIARSPRPAGPTTRPSEATLGAK